jgi:hypothetical protein
VEPVQAGCQAGDLADQLQLVAVLVEHDFPLNFVPNRRDQHTDPVCRCLVVMFLGTDWLPTYKTPEN